MTIKKRMLALIIIIGSLLSLALWACASPSGEGTDTGDGQDSGSAASLAGTSWNLASYGTPGAETPALDGTDVTLTFDAGTQAGGSGGCNTYGAQFQVTGSAIAFSDVISTLIACDDAVMQQEQQYFQALESSGEFNLEGDQLTIWYMDGQGALNFVRSASAQGT